MTYATVTDEPLLSADDEVRLARTIEAGVLAGETLRSGRWPDATVCPPGERARLRELGAAGTRARQRFLMANVRLVAMEVRRAAGRTSVGHDDLFQEGMLALAESLLRWDHTRGIRFAGYALPWVRNHIRAAAACRLGELESTTRVAQVRALKNEQLRLVQRLRREPTLSELAEAVGRSPGWVSETLHAGLPVSLHDAAGDVLEVADPRGETSMLAVLEVEWPAASELARLPEPVRTVLRWRYGFEGEAMSAAAVGRRLGRPAAQIRRLEQRGLELLRAVCPSQCRAVA